MKFPGKQKTQFSLFYLFIALTVLFVVQGWLVAPRAVEIPLSKFLSLLREGKVEKVSLTEREIRGTLKPGRPSHPTPGPWRQAAAPSSGASRAPPSSPPLASPPWTTRSS